MSSLDDDLPFESDWDIEPEAAHLDLDPSSLQREADYRNNESALSKLGFNGDLPSFEQVLKIVSGISPATTGFLSTHCKLPTLIVAPSDLVENPSRSFSIGVVSELDLQFTSRPIGQIYSMIVKLLDLNNLRFLHAHEWLVLYEMKKLSGTRAVPWGMHFPLHSYKSSISDKVPVANLIDRTVRFLMYPSERPVPSIITYYMAAMVGVDV